MVTSNSASDVIVHIATHDAIEQCVVSLQQDDDVSFFTAIKRIIEASGMDYSFIAALATLNSVSDPFYHPDMTRPMSASTVSRIARAQDLPVYATMKRLVVYGLGLSNEQCDWLDSKRRQEAYVHHTTNPQLVTAKVAAMKSKPAQRSSNKLPDWIRTSEQ